MRGPEFLADIESKLAQLIERGRSAGHSMSTDALNQAPDAKRWSAAQIFEHMMLGNAPYLPKIQAGIAEAGQVGPAEVRNTFAGKLIARAAGPQGNVPPPAPMIPKPGPYTPDVIDRWAAQTQAIIDLAKTAHQTNLNAAVVRNPFIKFVKMNLADCFWIITEHTARHIQQIEAIRQAKA